MSTRWVVHLALGVILGLSLTSACSGAPTHATDPTPVGAAAGSKAGAGRNNALESTPSVTAVAAASGEASDVESTIARGPLEPAATPNLLQAGSRVEEHTFLSPALGRAISYLVYLPPGYDATSVRYPSVYMLHGVAGDSSEWPSIGMPEAADRLVAAGSIQPMVIVFANADASYYVNNQTWGIRWSDYLVVDLVSEVDARHRTLADPASRGIAGLSMGGDGALQLAMRFPEVFGVAAAHSPSSRLLFEHVPADVYGTEAFFRAHNPFWLAQDAPGASKARLWIDIGDADPWQWNARAIHHALEARGIAHEFLPLPGEHDADYWIGNVELYLTFYSEALAGP